MNSSFRVRLRLPSSKQETLALPQPVTIRALLEGIQPFVNVDVAKIGLRLTYPPKDLDLGSPDEWDRDVKEVGINNGEGLLVKVMEGESMPVTEKSVPAEKPRPAEPVEHVQPQAQPAPRSLKDSILERVTQLKSWGRGRQAKDEPPEIPVEGGSVVLRIMEDDNSCMYFLLA